MFSVNSQRKYQLCRGNLFLLPMTDRFEKKKTNRYNSILTNSYVLRYTIIQQQYVLYIKSVRRVPLRVCESIFVNENNDNRTGK